MHAVVQRVVLELSSTAATSVGGVARRVETAATRRDFLRPGISNFPQFSKQTAMMASASVAESPRAEMPKFLRRASISVISATAVGRFGFYFVCWCAQNTDSSLTTDILTSFRERIKGMSNARGEVSFGGEGSVLGDAAAEEIVQAIIDGLCPAIQSVSLVLSNHFELFFNSLA